MLALAIPRTIAAWDGLAAAPATGKLQFAKDPSDDELETGIVGLRRSLSWESSARRLTELSSLELVRGTRLTQQDPRGSELFAQAAQHSMEGLMANPADGFAWLRLATIYRARGSSNQQVAAALDQSLRWAPNMRHLWLPRATMLLAYWQAFTPEQLFLMGDQLLTIWSTDQDYYHVPLLRAARLTGALPILAWAFRNNDTAYAELQALAVAVPAKPAP